jgi:hypothetical protein
MPWTDALTFHHDPPIISLHYTYVPFTSSPHFTSLHFTSLHFTSELSSASAMSLNSNSSQWLNPSNPLTNSPTNSLKEPTDFSLVLLTKSRHDCVENTASLLQWDCPHTFTSPYLSLSYRFKNCNCHLTHTGPVCEGGAKHSTVIAHTSTCFHIYGIFGWLHTCVTVVIKVFFIKWIQISKCSKM